MLLAEDLGGNNQLVFVSHGKTTIPKDEYVTYSQRDTSLRHDYTEDQEGIQPAVLDFSRTSRCGIKKEAPHPSVIAVVHYTSATFSKHISD